MALGAINHLGLTVTNLQKSKEFYAPIFQFLGYQNTGDLPSVSLWESVSTGSAVNLWQAKPEWVEHNHNDYAPGLHHLAFNAENKQEVDDFYQLLLSLKVNIVDIPSEYEYAPGYYAVFFSDPDGIRIELAHIPGLKFCCGKNA